MDNQPSNNQKPKRKGQAALEFMTTYGWAILMIMVSIAALSYFGFTNPQKLLPDKCAFNNGMICQDSQITTSAINMSVVNGLGKTAYNLQASPDGFLGTCFVNGVNLLASIGGDTAMKVDCIFPSPTLKAGEKKKFKVFLNYSKTSGGYTQVSLGEVYGTVK